MYIQVSRIYKRKNIINYILIKRRSNYAQKIPDAKENQ
jgi:hypothetical protein